MNSQSSVSETSRHQHLNVKEEIDVDSMEQVIKVEEECEDIEVDLKVEDEEKPTVCQCVECGSGGRGRVDRCTRAMDWSQAIKKEELEGDERCNEQQSGEMAVKEEGGSRGRVVKVEDEANWAPVRIKLEDIEAETGDELGCRKKAKQTEILVKEEMKEEENEINVAGPSTQRYGSGSADSVIIKFEDDDVTCHCEDCKTIKTEEGGEEVKKEEEAVNEVVPGHRVEEEVAVDGGESEDDEMVVEGGSEDEEDWLPSTANNSGSSSEEETEDGSTELVQEPIEMGPNTAPLEVRPGAGANIEQLRTAKGCKRRRCPQCQKMVTNLTLHLRTHTGKRPYICDQCGRSFNRKAYLNDHLTIHTGEKAFSCQHCNKCFALKHSLTDHLKRHKGEKAHQCDQCPSAFVTKGELTLHRRQHTGERPYNCHIANCGKAFASQSSLRTHLRFHTGDKRHHCEDCERRFVTRTELTRHRRYKHTTERPYRCLHSGCNYAAADKGNLKQHLNSKKHQQ